MRWCLVVVVEHDWLSSDCLYKILDECELCLVCHPGVGDKDISVAVRIRDIHHSRDNSVTLVLSCSTQ